MNKKPVLFAVTMLVLPLGWSPGLDRLKFTIGKYKDSGKLAPVAVRNG